MEAQILAAFVLGDLPVPLLFVIIGIVAAILIIIAAVFLIRGGNKQKDATPSGTNDWQSQSPQGGPAGGWNQQSQPGANAWNTQQAGGTWGNQPLPATAPIGWGNQQQQQPAANPWGTQQQQQQPVANTWAAQQPPAGTSWDQQPAANPWGTQQQQQPAANPWGTQQQQQPAANPWGTQQQQQPAANPWGTQQQQQPAANPWGAPAPSATPQEAWNQPQQSWGQSGASTSSPLQQGAPPFGSVAASEPAWGKPAQADSWGTAGAGISQPGQLPASNSQGWQQQQPGGLGQQGNMGGFNPPDNDKTMLRPTGPSVGSGVGYVRVEEGKEPGRVYEVRKEALSIGRSRESDIFLEDLAVSRLHASIVNMGNGNYALKDEGSANGTKVNGQLVNKFQTYPLQEGYRIQLGQTVLIFGQR
jgi:hypothetical protein